MAVKRRSEKRNKMADMHEKAVKIRCCYCDLKDTCKYRAQKERTEKMDIVTYCTMTPNRHKNFAKKAKTVVMGH